MIITCFVNFYHEKIQEQYTRSNIVVKGIAKEHIS